jgi:hypothetical protein
MKAPEGIRSARRICAALVLLLVVPAAWSAEVKVGRLTIQLPQEPWESREAPDLSLSLDNNPPLPGKSVVLVLRDPSLTAPLATLLVASTWGGPGRNDGTCTASARTYIHRMPTDGFLTFGCVMVGGPMTEKVARERVLKRLGPALAATAVAAPKSGYGLQILVTSHNGGAILIEGLLSPTLLGLHGADASASVPPNIPMAHAALTDAVGRAAVSAARSVFGALTLPAFESTVSNDKTTVQ